MKTTNKSWPMRAIMATSAGSILEEERERERERERTRGMPKENPRVDKGNPDIT
jgi:hypothetical protein